MKKVLSLVLVSIMVLSLSVVSFGAVDSKVKRAEAREVFEIVNAERKKAGKDPLTWVEELYQPAVTRAKELETEFSHTRPDGSEWKTVSKLANGENISWNRKTAASVMEQWMSSQGHKENILGSKYDYKGMAVGAVDSPKGPYWVILFTLDDTAKAETVTVGTTNTTETTGSKSPVVTAEGGVAVTTAAPVTEPTDNKSSYETTDLIKQLTEQAGKQKTGIVNPIVRAGKSISKSTIGELNAWATKNNRQVAISFDTLNSSGKGVQGRFNFYPARFSKQETPISVGVYVAADKVKVVAEKFGKWFANDMSIVYLDHAGDLVGTADIAARVDLSKLDTDNLVFYTYDLKNNKYAIQENMKYRVDSNGFLHFSTSETWVIVTDKELIRK